MNICDIMSTKVVSVDMDDKLSTVKELFDRLKFHHLLVSNQANCLVWYPIGTF